MKQINSRDTINITNPFNLLSEEALRMVVPYHHLPKKIMVFVKLVSSCLVLNYLREPIICWSKAVWPDVRALRATYRSDIIKHRLLP